jgi:hypothetical protein
VGAAEVLMLGAMAASMEIVRRVQEVMVDIVAAATGASVRLVLVMVMWVVVAAC